MDFDQLKYYVSVVQAHNFTSAAKRHHISQPAISRRINDLESELGCRLLLRDSHSVRFTDAGREFYEYAVSVLNQTDMTQQRLDNIAKGRVGRVSISSVPTSAHILRSVVMEFHKRYPMIQVDVDYSRGKDQIGSISQKKHDFYFSFKELLESQGNLDFLVTDKDRFELYVPANCAHMVNVNDLTRLSSLPLLCENRAVAPFLVNRILDMLKARGYNTANTIYQDSQAAVIDLANAGLGFTVFPHAVARSACTDGIVAFPLEGPDTETTNAIGWNPSTINDSTIKFLRVCQEMFSQK